jgi:hypothetical protein
MSDPNTTAKVWSTSVATLAVDALLDAGLVQRERFEDATAIVAEEIFVRLCCNDYPPSVDYEALNHEQAEQPKSK